MCIGFVKNLKCISRVIFKSKRYFTIILFKLVKIGVWTFAYNLDIQKRTQHFRNWIYFCPQVKMWGGMYSIGANRKSYSQSVDHFTNGWKQIQFLKCGVLFGVLDNEQSPETR